MSRKFSATHLTRRLFGAAAIAATALSVSAQAQTTNVTAVRLTAPVAPPPTVATTASPAASAASSVPTGTDYSSFRLIYERNIFDPNRYPRAVRTERTNVRPTRSRSDSFSLVGTMSYEKGAIAFFDGSNSDYRKSARPDDTIAGYTVVEVGNKRVKLVSGTNHLDMTVGSFMRRDEDGTWTLIPVNEETIPPLAPPGAGPGSENFAGVAGTNTTNLTANGEEGGPSDNPDNPPPPPDGGLAPDGAPGAPPPTNVDPVLLRMMQRRQQEDN